MTSTKPSAQLTAIVTGAARGIGLATTQLFLSKGYRVAMVDRDTTELHSVAAGLQNVLPVNCDVSQEDQVNAMMHTVLQWSGRVDVLVNNAGVADFAAIKDTTFERWQTVMRTNLDGVFLCSQAALPALRESRGCIVHTSRGLRHLESCGDSFDQTTGGRTRRMGHTGELRRTRTSENQARRCCAHTRHRQRLPRCDPAEPLRQ